MRKKNTWFLLATFVLCIFLGTSCRFIMKKTDSDSTDKTSLLDKKSKIELSYITQ